MIRAVLPSIHHSSFRIQHFSNRGRSNVERKDVRILVVDDEPMMTDSLKQNLVEEGYTVDTASNGAQAVELFDGSGHHLVVCDLQLPDKDMNGMDVLKHMKDTRPSTEVIVMTGYGTVERAVEATKEIGRASCRERVES